MQTVEELWEALQEVKLNGNAESYNLSADTLATYGSSLLDNLLSYFCFDSSRDMTLDVAARMKEDSKQSLLGELTRSSLVDRWRGVCWPFIEALPREWVAEHIEASIRPLLEDENDEFAYCQILDLLYEVNRGLYKKVAYEGTQSPNQSIRAGALDALVEDENLEREDEIAN